MANKLNPKNVTRSSTMNFDKIRCFPTIVLLIFKFITHSHIHVSMCAMRQVFAFTNALEYTLKRVCSLALLAYKKKQRKYNKN